MYVTFKRPNQVERRYLLNAYLDTTLDLSRGHVIDYTFYTTITRTPHMKKSLILENNTGVIYIKLYYILNQP